MVLFFSSCLDDLEIGLTNLKFKLIDKETHKLARQQSEFMISKIKKFLNKNNIDISNIKKIYFTNGPGSFTSNRLGVIFVKTLLILNSELQIYTIDTLSSLINNETGFVSISAKSGQFFTGKFKKGKLTGKIKITTEDKNNIIHNSSVVQNMINKIKDFKSIKHFNDIKTVYVKEI